MKLLPKSIKNKLIFSIALIHALLMTLFVFDLVQRQHQFLTEESSMAAQSIVQTYAANSIPWMLSNDLAGLEELTVTQAKLANVNFVMLLNNHGKILAYHNNINPEHDQNVGKYIEPPKLNPFRPNQSAHYYFNDENAIDISIPIWQTQSQLGWARVQLSRINTSNSIKIITNEGLLYTFIAILFGSLMAWYMGNNLTSRIYKLIENTQRIRQGERHIDFPTHGDDELSDLAHNFKSMLRQLNQNEEDLFEEKERAEITLRSIGDAVVVIDTHSIITYMNPAAEQITAWDHYLAQGKPVNEVMQLFDDTNKKPLENPGTRALRSSQVVGMSKNTTLVNRLGDTITLVDSAAPIIDRGGQTIGAILVFRDATEEYSLQQRLSWQATHDTLTELYNRTAFETELEKLIKLSAENPLHNSCLIYLDLDQFKVVNDTVGHTAGDILLNQIAVMLAQHTEKHGFLSRIGGDEFGILLNNFNLQQAQEFAEKLRYSISQHRFYWEGKRFQVSSSIGIALIHGNLSKTLILSRADIACYLAKDKGRDRIEMYHEDDLSRQQDQNIIDWVGRIRHALDENRFLLYAQKIVDLNADPDVKPTQQRYEILIRMKDQDGQIISPGQFLPAAERFDLMSELDLYITQRAIRWLKVHSEKIELLNINISGQSLSQENFSRKLLEFLEQNQANNHKICFEITETVAINQMSNTIDFLNKVKSFGCLLALDDFGSGFATFSWLKNLPVDFVKIDGAFITDVLHDPVDAVMVQTIRDIAEIMQIASIAEFVENEAVSDWLKTIGIHYAQGYHFDRPRPISEIFD
ncbi:hypothetical protein THMIRHAS_21240 [Thiosulfatimonas sediminis]|uniref:Sensor domain-containing diguanylate cyclase n=1 Tax=Thiosulfatimonas sediminis TaxID=2675054 RepID=A0A6F8PX99_9GAMM|nr:EAL domain-containing protein [Thiosulfatimonas sediminis]BBP46751.1 hypothetical protein THMIRHAS_21240 [Thiosulfatimonas sediminis]